MFITERHWKGANNDEDEDTVRRPGNVSHPDPGNHTFYSTRCMACKRLTDILYFKGNQSNIIQRLLDWRVPA